MSQNIVYLTGLYAPEHEAISKEIRLLQTHFPQSFVYGISSHDFLRCSLKNRYLVHYYRPFRLAPKLIAPIANRFDLAHIYHSLENTYFLDHLKKQPILLTAAAGGTLLDKTRYARVSKIIVESEYDLRRLQHAGFEDDRLALIYPGLDLDRFSYHEPTEDFSILFASSPFTTNYFAARGIALLLAAAAQCPNVRFVLLWRKWGETVPLIQTMVQGKTNVSVQVEHIKDIRDVLNTVHAVIAPFTLPTSNKPCPNSIIECLAAGKPVLVSDQVGIANLIRATQCGVVFQTHIADLVNAIAELQKNYAQYRRQARSCAQQYFSHEVFLNQYELLYNTILGDA